MEKRVATKKAHRVVPASQPKSLQPLRVAGALSPRDTQRLERVVRRIERGDAKATRELTHGIASTQDAVLGAIFTKNGLRAPAHSRLYEYSVYSGGDGGGDGNSRRVESR
jgi:hypothetical protein